MAFNVTVDYVRHLLRKNGCKAHVSIIPVSEIENTNKTAQEELGENKLAFRTAEQREPMRMAASVNLALSADLEADLNAMGVEVLKP